MPDLLDVSRLNKVKTLMDFDDQYTAPIHGFKDARDYYAKCSSLFFLKNIKTPVLILNAANDPFLSPECYPVSEVKDHPFVRLEVPDYGGHVGFTMFTSDKLYWSERRALRFMELTDKQ
jgi:predicted alpha/beta-fold hydrolase